MGSVPDMGGSNVGMEDRDYMQEPVRQRTLRAPAKRRGAGGGGPSWVQRARFAIWRLLRAARPEDAPPTDQKK